ncbi:MAG: hypothetical protein CL878_02135 [Dehalococcoidia bacterium]|nr:hypothetical protein [Dehalococcoidia bacterium]
MQGLIEYSDDVTGVIAVTDSGRSTGAVRNFLRVPAPGDLRNAMVTLSRADPLLRDLFQHRIISQRLNEFNGVAFGNLFIGALAQMTGSFERAVLETNRILEPAGRILPVTLTSTHLCAELVDGTLRYEEVSVRGLDKPSIQRVFLRDEEVEVYPGVVEAIKSADVITFGPGSLFTTVVASLLVKGVREAIAEARERGARTVYICNTTTQPGQTDGFTAYDHVAEVASYLGADLLDYALINTGVPSEAALDRFRHSGLLLLAVTPEEVRKITSLGVQVVAGGMIEQGSDERVLWDKQDAIRHDPAAVARELVEVFNQPRPQAAPAEEQSSTETPQTAPHLGWSRT